MFARPRTLLVLACSLALTQRGSAQSVVPSLTLHTRHFAERSVAWRFLVVTDTGERDVASMTVTTSLTEHAGKPALLSVRTFMTPRGQLLDSALADRATLAPIWQHSHQPTKTQMLDFGATAVTGSVTPKDSSARAVRHTLGERAFDTTNLDEVIASLPFAAGYSVVLPFYTFEQGAIERDTIAVAGVEQMAAPGGAMRSAWKVSFSDPIITCTYWIDRETRKILRQDVTQRRSGVRFRSVPLS
ncbi:MAG: hypothetical protein ABIT20_18470 [Gemmatimonadaceae bacterium]